MLRNFARTKIHTWLTTLSILSLGFVGWADEPTMPAQDTDKADCPATRVLDWKELTPKFEHPPVRILSVGRQGGATFVITHGMGGTKAGDRFHRLAAAIHERFPDARVLRIDWSELASAKLGYVPAPWTVAASIDNVGDQAAQLLQDEQIDPAQVTFIGESFGNWVNARIARQLGGVKGILAVNPAHEAGGYSLPDLRKHTQRSWSFHTYSAFDTTLEIAESDFWLETPPKATHWAQHVAGIHWLCARVEAGDSWWLNLDKPLPERRAGYFRASITLDGQLSDQQPSRTRPELTETPDPEQTPNPPLSLLATDVAVVAP